MADILTYDDFDYFITSAGGGSMVAQRSTVNPIAGVSSLLIQELVAGTHQVCFVPKATFAQGRTRGRLRVTYQLLAGEFHTSGPPEAGLNFMQSVRNIATAGAFYRVFLSGYPTTFVYLYRHNSGGLIGSATSLYAASAGTAMTGQHILQVEWHLSGTMQLIVSYCAGTDPANLNVRFNGIDPTPLLTSVSEGGHVRKASTLTPYSGRFDSMLFWGEA